MPCLGQPTESVGWETEKNHTARSKAVKLFTNGKIMVVVEQ